MSKVLVTGGAGFIGSHLCERLVAEGKQVVVVDDLSSGSEANLASVAAEATVIPCDILSIDEHRRALDGVTEIYHLAALISGYDSLNDPDAYVRTNVTGTMRLLEVARALHQPRILFASSSTVYGNSNVEQPRREDDLPEPSTVYALSKLAGEHLLKMYSLLYGFEFAILRLFNVYGPRQSPSHPYANVTCKFAYAAATGAPVTRYGDGEQTRDFVYVTDVVEAMVRTMASGRTSTYNVGTGVEVSINDLLSELGRIAGRPIPVVDAAPWPNDIRRIRADVGRAREDLGFHANTDVGDGLEATFEWFRRTGGGSRT